MSVQFGRCNFDGKPVDPKDLDEVRPVLAPYGPDGEGYICKDNVGILYRPFHTTRESHREAQPHLSPSGFVLTWDGRLDNRGELISQLSSEISRESTDVEIVAAAYRRWETDAFAKLIGDWALSIWDPKDQSLVLAKDFVGTRHLYYTVEKDQVTWCTILDPLVLFAGHRFKLEEEYIAGWLAFFPATHLTPFTGIRSVPPSCFVRLTQETEKTRRYWDFDPTHKIRYRTDAEYEEHFRALFRESVRRRLRSDSPVLAELSGGMDSSSIVCMADDTMRNPSGVETQRLDTISYYNDSEPNWNERPYFTTVEEERGSTGFHVEVGGEAFLIGEFESDTFAATPAHVGCQNEATRQVSAHIAAQGNRVVFSGVGGDEVTGGVPTPVPELMDLIASGRIGTLARQLNCWALNKRKPWLHLLLEALVRFLPPISVPRHRRPATWLARDFVRRHSWCLHGYETRLRFFGAVPSFQENISVLDGLRRQLACENLSSRPPLEKRYPYLDRNLLEFLYGVPREQLVRPGQRRSLMRRALVGIVPELILNRKRKAYVTRSPMALISTFGSSLAETNESMQSASLGIIDAKSFRESVLKVSQGEEVPIVTLVRTVMIESWLRRVRRVTTIPECSRERPRPPASSTAAPMLIQKSFGSRVQLASCATNANKKGGDNQCSTRSLN